MKNIHDIKQIKARVVPLIDQLIKQLYPEAKKQGSCYRIGDPDGSGGRSMKIETSPSNCGDFFDHATMESGSIVKLVALAKNISNREAIEWLAAYTKTEPVKALQTKIKEVDSEKLAKQKRPLAQALVDKIQKERGISEATLLKYQVGKGTSGEVVFPHFINDSDKIGMLKHWGEDKKIWTNENCVHSLFGKHVCDPDSIGTEQLVITEGQWDALSLYEVGIDAVSIPSGVSNMEWITEDYPFLSLFEKIVLAFDSDEAGVRAAREAAQRLGEDRCFIVNFPLKDANEMLLAGRKEDMAKAIEMSMRQPLTGIIDPYDIKEATRAYCRGENVKQGIPFFIPEMEFYFRWHEMTLFFGPTSMGKSSIVQNQVGYLSSIGEKCLIASFEQHPSNTLGAILMAKHCHADLPNNDEQYDAAYDDLAQSVFFYKSRSKTDPQHLVRTFEHAHKQHNIRHFVIDNVMTLNVDRQDNTAQSNTADMFREFVANYPVHLYIVAHPRKPQDTPTGPPPIHEIQGASEWGNMPHNIIAVWRNLEKQERLEQMRQDGISEREIRNEWESCPDGQVVCRKQRLTGLLPSSPTYFHKEVQRFTRTNKPPMPFKE